MSDRIATRSALKRWLVANSRVDIPIDDNTPILELRVIDSLKLLELVLLVEELSGRPVAVELLEPHSFRDIDTIARRFFTTAPAGDPNGR